VGIDDVEQLLATLLRHHFPVDLSGAILRNDKALRTLARQLSRAGCGDRIWIESIIATVADNLDPETATVLAETHDWSALINRII
jgi:hypothetical protein